MATTTLMRPLSAPTSGASIGGPAVGDRRQIEGGAAGTIGARHRRGHGSSEIICPDAPNTASGVRGRTPDVCPAAEPNQPPPPPVEPSGSAPVVADRVIGKDGKSYPAKKETGKAIQFDEKKAQAPSQARNTAVSSFSALLHHQLPETLADLTRILQGESGRISAIPKPKRVDLARAFLAALGVGREDLADGGAA